MNAITTETTVQDLLNHALDLKADKADWTGAPVQFVFDGNGRMNHVDTLTGFAMTPLAPNERAMMHLCGKLGAAYGLTSLDRQHFTALQKVAPELLAANFNDAIGRLKGNGGWLVRSYKDECRAVLSNQYLVIDNDTMLGTLNAVLVEDKTPHRISTRSFVNVDNMCVDVRFKDVVTPHRDGGGNDQWGLGIRIRNGEVGDWSGGVYPMLWRGSCDNSISFDDRASSFVFKHFGQKTMGSKKVMLKAAMSEILPFAATILDKMIEADGAALPSFGDIVNGLGYQHGWSEEFTQAVFAGTERRETLAGLVNGITYAAHTKATQEDGVDAEFLAGRLLFDERGAMVNEARTIAENAQRREEAREARKAARAERNNVPTRWRVS